MFDQSGGWDMSDMRGSVLAEAADVINGERQDVYGEPEDSFFLIADFWSVYLGKKYEDVCLSREDVAMMMTLFKIAREMHQRKRDNIRDAAGYLGIYADMQSNEAPVAESMTFEWKKAGEINQKGIYTGV